MLNFWPILRVHMLIGFMVIKKKRVLSLLRIWSHLLKKSFMENFISCAVGIFIFDSEVSLTHFESLQDFWFKKSCTCCAIKDF